MRTSRTCRLDAAPEYYMENKDQETIVEPGYEVGGPLWRNKLWLFSSYIPSIDTTRRVTNFTGANPGPRTLDPDPPRRTTLTTAWTTVSTNSLRLFGILELRLLPADRNAGRCRIAPPARRNTGASTDPNTLRADAGSVNPVSICSFGGDWTPTAETRCQRPLWVLLQQHPGTRQSHPATGIVTTTPQTPPPWTWRAQPFQPRFRTPPVSPISRAIWPPLFDAYKRKSLNADLSYFVHFAGTHTFKVGYFHQTQANEVLRTFNGGFVNHELGAELYAGDQQHGVRLDHRAEQCAIRQPVCRGRYGYFTVGNGVVNTGGSQPDRPSLYFQDTWQVARHLTLNLGIRFDTGNAAPLRSHAIPLGRLRIRRQDRSSHRRRLRPAA